MLVKYVNITTKKKAKALPRIYDKGAGLIQSFALLWCDICNCRQFVSGSTCNTNLAAEWSRQWRVTWSWSWAGGGSWRRRVASWTGEAGRWLEGRGRHRTVEPPGSVGGDNMYLYLWWYSWEGEVWLLYILKKSENYIGPLLDDRLKGNLKKNILKPWKGVLCFHFHCLFVCLCVCLYVCLSPSYRAHLLA